MNLTEAISQLNNWITWITHKGIELDLREHEKPVWLDEWIRVHRPELWEDFRQWSPEAATLLEQTELEKVLSVEAANGS